MVEFPSSVEGTPNPSPTFVGEVVKDEGGGRYTIDYAINGRRQSATVAGEKLTRLNNVASLGQRTWTDPTGRFRIQATLDKHEKNEVQLKQADGTVTNVNVAALNPTDKAYLASIKTAPVTGGRSPFEGGTTAGPEPPPNAFANGKSVTLLKADWTYQPTKTAATKDITAAGLAIEISDGVSGFVLSSDRTKGILSSNERGGDFTTFVMWDVQSGEQLDVTELAGRSLVAADVHNDGQHFLIGGGDSSRGSNSEVRLMNVAGEEVFKWKIGDRFNRPKQMRLIGTKGLLVVDSKNNLTLWNWVTKQLVYKIQLDERQGPILAFTDDGRTCAMLVRGGENPGIHLLSVSSGRILGTITTPPQKQPSRLAFNPSGTKLAGLHSPNSRSDRTIFVWDLVPQSQWAKPVSISIPRQFGVVNSDGFDWCDDRYLFSTGELVDTKLRAIVWRYSLPSSGLRKSRLQRLQPGTLLVAAEGREQAKILPIVIPHETALNAIGDADARKVFSIKPGTAVKIDADLSSFSDKHRKQVEGAIKSWMTDFEPNDQAELVLSVNVEKLAELQVETVKADPRGPRQRGPRQRPKPEIQTVMTTPHKHTVTLKHAKAGVLYEFEQIRDLTRSVRLREGDTPQQAADRDFGPNGFAINSQIYAIPKFYLLSESGGPPFVAGKSSLNEKGALVDHK